MDMFYQPISSKNDLDTHLATMVGLLVDLFNVHVSKITTIPTEVHSARSFLVVTHPSTNRGRRNLTSANESLSQHWSPPRTSIGSVLNWFVCTAAGVSAVNLHLYCNNRLLGCSCFKIPGNLVNNMRYTFFHSHSQSSNHHHRFPTSAYISRLEKRRITNLHTYSCVTRVCVWAS